MTEHDILKAVWYTMGSPYDQSNIDKTKKMLAVLEAVRERDKIEIDLSFSRDAPMKTYRPVLALATAATTYIHDCSPSRYRMLIIAAYRRWRKYLDALEERNNPMAEKKQAKPAKCTCKAAPCEKTHAPLKPAKVPNKKETAKLANAVRKAQAEYTCAIVALINALLAREAIKAKSPVVTKFAKASALEKEAIDLIGELGY
ncbi:MAG: hypothetical protein IKE69_11420 [Thermoguttaceae bacterium]|nr:hypothetical protein [Thermoguttaceae bacterium]